MQIYQVLMALVGVLFIFAGLLTSRESSIRRQIDFINTLRGTTTKITKGTILAHRISNIVIICMGLGLIIFAFFFPWASFESY